MMQKRELLGGNGKDHLFLGWKAVQIIKQEYVGLYFNEIVPF